MTYTNESIKKYLSLMKECLSEKRYIHSLGVAYMSASLGYVYDVPQDKALVAGILHDCAKETDGSTLIKLCDENHVVLTEAERSNTSLIHSKYGAYLAKNLYGIDDKDIINAIANHTVGRENMSRLEQIVFCADFLEPMRTQKCSPSLDELRKLIYTDIDLTTVIILENVIDYLKKNEALIDPASIKTLEYYKSKKRM